MSREEVCLRPQFKRVLQLYGFDDPNSFLVDSCPESVTTTMRSLQPMSVTTHGTVLKEIIPTSQIIQVLTNITNGSASDISVISTEFPAKVTYVGDSTFTMSKINLNTNIPIMNSQTDTMVVDIETHPHVRPMESSTNQIETTVLNEQEFKSSNEIDDIDTVKPNNPVVTETIVRDDMIYKDSTMASIVTQMIQNSDYSSSEINSQIDKMTDYTTINDSESHTSPITETSIVQLYQSTESNDASNTLITSVFDKLDETTFPPNSYVTSTKNIPDITIETSESPLQETSTTTTSINDELNEPTVPSMMKDEYIPIRNTANTIMIKTNEVITDTIDEKTKSIDDTTKIIQLSTKPMSNDDSTTIANTISENPVNDQTTLSMISGLNENIMSTTDVLSTIANWNNATESEIIKVAESNQRYQIASLLERKSARSVESSDNLLPTFNVEFVVRKEDLRPDCNNKTRKRTIIKPEKILTEYPKDSGISITLRESKNRRRRHLEQCKVLKA